MKGFPVETAFPMTQYQNSWNTNWNGTLIVFCMGVTCSGKSTFIDFCTEEDERIGAIKVGEEMRMRHDPERFRGLAAMPDTEDEVWEIFNQQLDDRVKEGKSIILVDGQPRLPIQVDRCFNIVEENGFLSIFLWFFVEDEELKTRMNKRFEGHIGALNLSKERMTNDKVQLYDVMLTIYRSKHFDVNFHLPKVVGPSDFKFRLKQLQNFEI